jgi:hypothetical protein
MRDDAALHEMHIFFWFATELGILRTEAGVGAQDDSSVSERAARSPAGDGSRR